MSEIEPRLKYDKLPLAIVTAQIDQAFEDINQSYRDAMKKMMMFLQQSQILQTASDDDFVATIKDLFSSYAYCHAQGESVKFFYDNGYRPDMELLTRFGITPETEIWDAFRVVASSPIRLFNIEFILRKDKGHATAK